MTINYADAAVIYLKLLKENKKVSQVTYCEQLSLKLKETVVLRTFRAHLAKIRKSIKSENNDLKIDDYINSDGRYDWERLKTAFLTGQWRTVAEFGRAIGAKPRSAQFLSMTAGWTAQKKQLRKQITTKTVELLVETGISDRVRDLSREVKALQWKFFDGLIKTADAIGLWKPMETPFACATAATFLKSGQEVLLRLIPSLCGLEKLESINDILNRVRSGKLDVAEATIELTMLGVQVPDVLKIMLTRGVGEDAHDDGGELVTNEKIQERRRQLFAEIDKERTEFVPQRTREVNELKEELKSIDSFEEHKKLTETDPTGTCC